MKIILIMLTLLSCAANAETYFTNIVNKTGRALYYQNSVGSTPILIENNVGYTASHVITWDIANTDGWDGYIGHTYGNEGGVLSTSLVKSTLFNDITPFFTGIYMTISSKKVAKYAGVVFVYSTIN